MSARVRIQAGYPTPSVQTVGSKDCFLLKYLNQLPSWSRLPIPLLPGWSGLPIALLPGCSGLPIALLPGWLALGYHSPALLLGHDDMAHERQGFFPLHKPIPTPFPKPDTAMQKQFSNRALAACQAPGTCTSFLWYPAIPPTIKSLLSSFDRQ